MTIAALESAVRVTPFSSAPLWYVTRSAGIVSFLLLTATLILGVAATNRALASPRWPRFATQTLHRNTSLMGLVLLFVHIGTTVMDSFVSVPWRSTVLPFASPYKRFAVGLGTVAFDLLLITIVSSLIRTRLPLRVWRGLHLTAYLLWPVSLLHFLLAGTDAKGGQIGMYLGLGGAGAVGVAVAVRVLALRQQPGLVSSIPR